MTIIGWISLKPCDKTHEALEVFEENEQSLVDDIKSIYKEVKDDKLTVDQAYLGSSEIQFTGKINETQKKFFKDKLGENKDQLKIMEYSKDSWITRQKRFGEMLKRLQTLKEDVNQKWQVADGIIKRKDKPVAKIKMINMDKLTPLVNSTLKRQVYTLTAWDGADGAKEYVKDDLGVLTRRYAYCVRPGVETIPVPMLKVLPVSEDVLSGTYLNTDNSTKHPDYAQLLDKLFGNNKVARNAWGISLNNNEKLFLAYLNYSNNGVFGVCLSSTVKKIRANDGELFLNGANYDIWEVDLARIPVDVVLVNIYANPSPIAVSPYHGGKVKDDKWVAAGTVKNRELFCSKIPAEACTRPTGLVNGTFKTFQLQIENTAFIKPRKSALSLTPIPSLQEKKVSDSERKVFTAFDIDIVLNTDGKYIRRYLYIFVKNKPITDQALTIDAKEDLYTSKEEISNYETIWKFKSLIKIDLAFVPQDITLTKRSSKLLSWSKTIETLKKSSNTTEQIEKMQKDIDAELALTYGAYYFSTKTQIKEFEEVVKIV